MLLVSLRFLGIGGHRLRLVIGIPASGQGRGIGSYRVGW